MEVQHVEKNGTQCFKSGSNDKWDNNNKKFDQDESNVIVNRPEGKLSQSEAENFRAELIGPVNTESRGQKRQGEDVEELTTKGLNYQDGEVLIPIKST